MNWDNTSDSYLREWHGKKSNAEIGQFLHRTRNSVIGRSQRLGLERLKKAHCSTYAPKRNAGAVMASIKKRAERAENPPKQPTIERKLPPQPIEPLNIPLMKLTPFQCREVVGHDYLALYCGHPIYKLSNCAWHFSINRERRT